MQIMAGLFSSDLINIFTMIDGPQSYEKLLSSFANTYKLSFYENGSGDEVDLPEYHDIPLPGTFLIFLVNQYKEYMKALGPGPEGNGTVGQMGFLNALNNLNSKLAEDGKKYKINHLLAISEGSNDNDSDPTKRDWMVKIIEEEEEDAEDEEGHEDEDNNEADDDEETSDEEDEDEDGKPRVLSLHNDVWCTMFDVIVDPIVAHCRNILATDEMKDTKYIFLVGGFANSKYFQMRMQSEFGKRKIVTPDLPSLCVVDGAARYGLNSNFVKIRKMPRTYGCSIGIPKSQLNLSRYSADFIKKYSFQSPRSSAPCLSHCFNVYQKLGDAVKLGSKPVVKTLMKRDPNACSLSTYIYCSTKRDPLTVVEDGCEQLAKITIPMKKEEMQCVIEFWFSNTMITVFAYPKGKENAKVQCKVNYL